MYEPRLRRGCHGTVDPMRWNSLKNTVCLLLLIGATPGVVGDDDPEIPPTVDTELIKELVVAACNAYIEPESSLDWVAEMCTAVVEASFCIVEAGIEFGTSSKALDFANKGDTIWIQAYSGGKNGGTIGWLEGYIGSNALGYCL